MKKFNELVEKSIKTVINQDWPCNEDLKVDVDGKLTIFKAYSCSVSNRDLLFFCDIGTVTYLVDMVGGKPYAVLYDYDLD
jgi:hypothetical protein